MTKRRIAILIASVFLLGAVAVVPTATAQGGAGLSKAVFKFDISGLPSGPMTPLVAQNFKIDYDFEMTTPLQNLAGVSGPASVEFTFNCDPGVSVSGATTDVIVIDPTPTAGTYAADGSLSFQLAVNRDVRALDLLNCRVESDVSTPNTQTVPAPDPVVKSFQVQADYFSLIEAKTDLKLKQGGPQKQIPFTLEVTNFGNGQTKINFEMTEKPGGKWQGLAPDVLLLDEKGGERASSPVTFTVVTPFKNGWNNEEGAFTILLKPEYSFDNNKKGSEVAVTLVARVRGVYVPSLEPLVMVGAVLGTALVARMMRDEE